jgi:hypothetical protein
MPPDAKGFPMLRTSLIFLSCGLLLTGCGRGGLAQVENAAEDARVSTERMVDSAEARSNARQARIFAEAAEMQRADTARREGPRYEARKDGAGDNWIIYDTTTGAPARVGTQVQTGLTRAQADANLARMEEDYVSVFRK